MRYPAWVNVVSGVPTVSNFTTTEGMGTPIVIDSTTNISYYLAEGDIVTAIGSAGGDGNWIPLVDGSEPPNFITDGAGVLILVAGP